MLPDSWDRIDCQCDALLVRYQHSQSRSEKESILKEFLTLLDSTVAKNTMEFDTLAFNAVARWLDSRSCEFELWKWIGDVARRADTLRRVALTIAIFECVPEDPADERYLINLFDFLSDPDLQWTVAAAYERYPERLFPHFVRYLEIEGRYQTLK